jgi:beta-lactamase regulating signal transducer with metallopeptidase domain
VIGVVPGVAAAVVAGLRTPRIYCSEDVLVTLEADELAAVILHERHHAQTYAPAKLVALAALARLIGRTRSGAAWIESERSRIEIAADDHAITNGATRPALAGAILKLAQGSPTQTLAGFASAADRRIRALLGEASTAPRTRRPMPMIILGPVAAVVACALLPML